MHTDQQDPSRGSGVHEVPTCAEAIRLNAIGTETHRNVQRWLFALAIIWLGILYPLDKGIAELREERKAIQSKINHTNRAISNFNRKDLAASASAEQDSTNSPNLENPDQSATTSQKLDELHEQQIERNKRLKQLTLDKVEPFGIPLAITIPTPLILVIWMFMALGLLLYLAHTRDVMLNLVARSICAFTERGVASTLYPRSIGGMPYASWWWLAPLPRQVGSNNIAPDQVRDALGWKYLERRAYLLTTTIFGIMLMAQIHVAWLSFQVHRDVTTGSEAAIATIIVWFLLGVFVSLTALWLFCPWPVPDQGTNSQAPDNPLRRNFIASSALLITPTLFGFTAPVASWFLEKQNRRRQDKIKPQPRKHRRAKPVLVTPSLSTGFYRKPKSHVVHYVTASGVMHNLTNLNVGPGHRLSVTQTTFKSAEPHVNLATASESFEDAALSELLLAKKENFRGPHLDAACRLLLDGVRHDLRLKRKTGQNPSFRLYDLLAGVAIRFNQRGYLNALIQIVSSEGARPVRMNGYQQLESRQKSWKDKGSGVYKRWSNHDHPTTWKLPCRSASGKSTVRELVF